MTHEIKDINLLEASIQELIKSNQKIVDETSNLESIVNELKSNYQFDNAKDINRAIEELNISIEKLKETINPTIERYSKTMNKLVSESRTIGNKSI